MPSSLTATSARAARDGSANPRAPAPVRTTAASRSTHGKAARSEDGERTALAPAPKAARTSCFKIRDVVGVDLCVEASARQRRVGRALDEHNISYKVRGGFGEDKDDEMLPDTRWVPLSELAANLKEQDLKALDKWAAALEKSAKTLRKELQKRRDS